MGGWKQAALVSPTRNPTELLPANYRKQAESPKAAVPLSLRKTPDGRILRPNTKFDGQAMHFLEGIAILVFIGAGLVACERTKLGIHRPASGDSRPGAINPPREESPGGRKETVRIVGDFTPEDLSSIRSIVRSHGPSMVLSIVRKGTTVTVHTCSEDGPPCGWGCKYTLEKVDEKWTLIAAGCYDS
jgi:hypothetical protein